MIEWYILVFFAIVCLADIGFSYKDQYTAATWLLVIGVLFVSGHGWWTGGLNPLVWVWNNPVDAITGFVAYAAVGCLWSVAKWWLFLKKTFKYAEAEYEKALAGYNASSIHQSEPKRVRPYESYASRNKARLTGWIFHWPFSMLSVLIGDFILRFADSLYKACLL